MEYSVNLDLIRNSLRKLAFENFQYFQRSREMGQIDAAIFYIRITLGLCPQKHPDRSETLDDLGMFLHARFEQYGRIQDLEETIEQMRAALGLRPDGHPKRYATLNNLAHSLRTRFERYARTADLDEAVELRRAALELCPHGHPYRFASLHGLAASLGTRFGQYGRPADLDEAIKHSRATLALCPSGHPVRISSLTNLGLSLQILFERHGHIADLNEAIERHRAALALFPNSHPDRSLPLNNLALSLQIRFRQLGRTADLDEAIRHQRTALELCPTGHHKRPASLNNLANSLGIRFQFDGRTADLDEAIECHRAAMELLRDGHADCPASLNNLADCLRTRFEQYGQIADLDEAIEHLRVALQLFPNSHPDRSLPLNNLAVSLGIRFGQQGQTADLDEAIEHFRAALDLRPKGNHNRSSSLNNLALSLQVRFGENGQTGGLDEAVEYHRAALGLCPDGHPNRSSSLANLANSLTTRFERHGRTTDLDEAIALHRAALKLRPEGHPDHSGSLRNFALLLYSQFKTFGLMDNFDDCMQLLEDATMYKFSSLVIRLEAASQWATLAQLHAHHTVSRAYKMALQLLQRALIISPTLHAQHDFLKRKNPYSHHRTFTRDAVANAVKENNLEEAIEILEQGRGLLWSQMRGFRMPLDLLAETNRELADRFRNVSNRLEGLVTSSTGLQPESTAAGIGSSVLDIYRERKMSEERLRLKRQLSNEQEEIITEIRGIPGFKDFLTATPFKILQGGGASEGPIIVVNHSRFRSDALIMLARGDLPVVCVPLDGEFYEDSIELYTKLLKTRQRCTASSSEYDEVLREAMKMLWDRAVSKVVNKLEELGITEGVRLWWCPTSVLSALPFHSAGPFNDADGTTKYLLDKYVSSYTPTLGTLINARLDGHGGEPNALIVGDTSLPSAKDEIRKIKNCGIMTRLLSSNASHDALIKELRKTTWVHFVCHGGLDPKPFNSSFKVSDRGLTWLDIIQANLPSAEFAFLSACHTAEQPHDGTHDEVLHLAAAMQFSGFRSVIGSMWELLDVDGPFFAKTVYEYMSDCDEGEAMHKRAAAGLRKAAVELKERPGIQTERWVNLIHIGV
ncbi:TPR-like protein [Fomitiporia mediterranea MF3/22]|uniref:TPR-like protein n=1 Tax=Fomitiporia mediterranea (strain MF3/22) TaxID=694068 RepID=UPI000440869C|nr:TPR-like protein [Fomitiporia mediterranea MF3/22]EJD07721.1 TPR-like protein [Fomitiporia mediterranea MF3/22]